jgi:aryl-alcohol dehydrogenase-like predicted oxidoreductase
MEQRTLGRTGRPVSVIGLGTWQLGADWGDVSEADAAAVLDAAHADGVTFFDTADVYGDGRSETIVGAWRARLPDVEMAGVTVATKMGRRQDQTLENYSARNFRTWNDRSRANLGMDTLDLVQLHCPPTDVYRSDAVFDALDALVDDG